MSYLLSSPFNDCRLDLSIVLRSESIFRPILWHACVRLLSPDPMYEVELHGLLVNAGL